jgi:hypothetical protein
VVVSGVPRSGTSLMMQMLAAGGLEPLTDGARAADAWNPRGYLEWEPVKALARDPGAVEAARGRALKVVSALLPALPREHRYHVVWMERDAREVAASQEAMLAATTGAAGTAGRDGAVTPELLARHVARTRAWLATQPHVATCAVAFRDAVLAPRAAAARVREFLALDLDVARMAAAVDPALYRFRS